MPRQGRRSPRLLPRLDSTLVSSRAVSAQAARLQGNPVVAGAHAACGSSITPRGPLRRSALEPRSGLRDAHAADAGMGERVPTVEPVEATGPDPLEDHALRVGQRVALPRRVVVVED